MRLRERERYTQKITGVTISPLGVTSKSQVAGKRSTVPEID